MEEYSRFSFNDAPLTALRAAGAIAVAGLVIALSYYSIRGPREVVAVIPYADGQRAAVLMTKGGGDMVMLVDAEDGVLWSASMPMSFRPDMVRAGASVGGPTITVRGFQHLGTDMEAVLAPQRTVKTWAFSAQDGTSAWAGADSGLPMKAAVAPPYVSNLSDEQSLYEIHMSKPHSVVGVDRATGAETLRVAIPEEWSDVDAIARAWLHKKWLILDQPATFAYIDRATQEIHPTRVRQWPCVLGEAVYYEPESANVLTRRSLDDLSDTPLFDLTGYLTGQCGARGANVIFGVEDEFTGDLLAIDVASGQPAWTVDLGAWSLDSPNTRDVRTSHATQAPLSGDLPRFVPLQVIDFGLRGDKGLQHGVAMIDLDERRVAWVANDPALAEWQLLREGDAYYLFRANSVVKLDGATGNPAWAVKIEGAASIRPHQFASGRLWLYGDQVVRVLDLANAHLHGGWGWAPMKTVDIGPEIGVLLDGK